MIKLCSSILLGTLFVLHTSMVRDVVAQDATTTVRSDQVLLHSGQTLYGSITQSRIGPRNDEELELVLDDGSKLILHRDLYQSWKPESAALPEYRERLEKAVRTVDSQWELAQWCKENNLKPQADTHARLVVELDPEHEPARRALNHQRIRGRWQDPEVEKKREGRIKVKTEWVLPEIVDIKNAMAAYNEKQLAWKKDLTLLFKQALGTGSKAGEATNKIRNVRDPEAVETLVARLVETKPVPSIRERSVIVEVLCEIPTHSSTMALLDYYMNNRDDGEGRDRAIQAIAKRPAHQPQVARRLVQDLDVDKSGDREKLTNRTVALDNHLRLERAATALRVINASVGIEALIVSIQVPYTIKVKVRENAALSGGNVQGGGGTREITDTFVLENLSAVETLEKFTGQKFGKNQDAWLKWWIAENTPQYLNLRRDR
ncbi:MAG: hypothetical protein Q8M16_06120 [Pirellulaceae bacterium]|nr:hypothetical protein [Pirellulaceae bacterium]